MRPEGQGGLSAAGLFSFGISGSAKLGADWRRGATRARPWSGALQGPANVLAVARIGFPSAHAPDNPRRVAVKPLQGIKIALAEGNWGIAAPQNSGIYLLRYDAMAVQLDLSSGWKTYEVLGRDGLGNHTITPFSDCLATSGKILAQPIIKMRKVQEIGWPEAKRVLKDGHGHPLIVKRAT